MALLDSALAWALAAACASLVLHLAAWCALGRPVRRVFRLGVIVLAGVSELVFAPSCLCKDLDDRVSGSMGLAAFWGVAFTLFAFGVDGVAQRLRAGPADDRR